MLGVILFLFSILAFLGGLFIFSESKSVLHEILAGILLIISCIFFTGTFIVAIIDSAKSKNTELLSQIRDELRKTKSQKYPHESEDEK